MYSFTEANKNEIIKKYSTNIYLIGQKKNIEMNDDQYEYRLYRNRYILKADFEDFEGYLRN